MCYIAKDIVIKFERFYMDLLLIDRILKFHILMKWKEGGEEAMKDQLKFSFEQ